MNFGTRLLTAAQLALGYDKAALSAIKSMSTFTNEPAIFNAPIYGLTPPDVYLGSVDYRGVDNPLTGGNASKNFLELFDCVPEIFAPIHAIASRIANADFQLRKYRNDAIVYDNEDWNRLYNTPNPLQHFRELMYEAIVYEYVTGNEYMYFNTPSTLTQDYRNIVGIWNLPADQIAPIANSSLNLFKTTSIEEVVSKFKLDDKNFFETKDVLHIKAVNLDWKARKIKGRSPLLSADKALSNLIAVYSARKAIYVKRGALGAIVSRKSDDSGLIPLQKGEKERMRADFNGDFGLNGNKDLVSITDQPVDFIRFGMSITDLQPFEETYLDAKMIYAVLGVPEDMMPNQKGATFENQIQAERRLYNGVIIPKANMYMQSLTNKLGLNEAKLYLHASFEHIEALQENKKDKAATDELVGKVFLQRFDSGVCSLNDWSVAIGNDKHSDPLCDKRVFEMTDDEIAKVKATFRMTMTNAPKTNADGTGQNTGATDQNSGQN